MRNIARELLPYVVVLWATFALLGGAMKPAEHVEASGGDAVVKAGIGLCAISVAYLLKTAGERVRPFLRRIFSLIRAWSSLVTGRRPVAYYRPPPIPPSLDRLQVLRT